MARDVSLAEVVSARVEPLREGAGCGLDRDRVRLHDHLREQRVQHRAQVDHARHEGEVDDRHPRRQR